MTISVTCENCDREIRAKDEAAGKTVRCPGCSEPVRIPKPRVAKPAVKKPKPAEPEDGDVDWGKAAAMASNADEATKPCPACGEDVGLRDEKCESCGEKLIGKKSKSGSSSRSKSSRASSGDGMEVWLIALIAFVALNIVCLGVGLAIPSARLPAVLGAFFASACLSLWGYFWFLKVASEDSTTALLLCLFVPCYSLYYLCTNQDTAGRPFAVQCLGSFLAFITTKLLAPS